MFQESDVYYYLSGGAANSDPAKSLGGRPSAVAVGGSAGNLFGTVTQGEAGGGATAYRCLYVFNEGAATMYNVKVWLAQSGLLSPLAVGVAAATEVQRISLGGDVVGGTLSLGYASAVEGVPVTQSTNPITFSPNPTAMAANVANALNDLELLSDVTVAAAFVAGVGWQYDVTFGGAHAGRAHSLLSVSAGGILGYGVTAAVSQVTAGRPVNAVAADIGFANEAPRGVTFSTADSVSAAVPVGTLNPLDGFAVWLRRTTAAGTVPTSGAVDRATLKVAASVTT